MDLNIFRLILGPLSMEIHLEGIPTRLRGHCLGFGAYSDSAGVNLTSSQTILRDCASDCTI